MTMKHKFLLAFLLGFITNMSLFSDEGMWLFNDPPFALLSQRHNFTLTNPWLENACLHRSGSTTVDQGVLFPLMA